MDAIQPPPRKYALRTIDANINSKTDATSSTKIGGKKKVSKSSCDVTTTPCKHTTPRKGALAATVAAANFTPQHDKEDRHNGALFHTPASRRKSGNVCRTPGRTPKGNLPSPFPLQKRLKTKQTPAKKQESQKKKKNYYNGLRSCERQELQNDYLKDPKEVFDRVCSERTCEDFEEELCDLGIKEWSMDDFTILRKLGQGGSANVYLAEEIQSGYQVAMKFQRYDDNAFCEIDIHHPLEHPNIIRMIGYFYSFTNPLLNFEEEINNENDNDNNDDDDDDSKSSSYLCMILEYCEGGSLHDVIETSEDFVLDEYQAAKYFYDALKAMEYLHSKRIIHCDCKPANFLLDKHTDTLKLADFGMSVHDNDKEVLGGSPVYMSPEHLLAWRHNTESFDNRSDIYSLGVVLYEMLLGYLPYEVIEAEKGDNNNKSSRANKTSSKSKQQKSMMSYNSKSSTESSFDDGEDENIDGLSIDDDDEYEDYDYDEDDSYDGFPVLDLRKLNDKSSNEPFYVPPPIFIEEISDEAEDLILRLMEPSLKKRISIAEAKKHEWFQINCVGDYFDDYDDDDEDDDDDDEEDFDDYDDDEDFDFDDDDDDDDDDDGDY